MSEQDDTQRDGPPSDLAGELAVTGAVEAGCCLLNLLTVFVLFLSVSTLLLVNR